jgi:hypothetical protein
MATVARKHEDVMPNSNDNRKTDEDPRFSRQGGGSPGRSEDVEAQVRHYAESTRGSLAQVHRYAESVGGVIPEDLRQEIEKRDAEFTKSAGKTGGRSSRNRRRR